MSSQPFSGDQWTSVSGGVGTTVVTDRSCTLRRVLIPGTYVGTINFHDTATAAGTTSTSQIFSLGLPASAVPVELDVHAKCRYGLVYQATGTPVLTFTWD